MPGPLHGYRVVDLTSNVAGPLATMILADQGADVIKVEAPDGGDATRSGGNRRAGFTASFLNNNRNKRSIVLDLKTAGGREALLQLAAGADVFVQNFRPGVADRLGVGEEAVRAVSPRIVYVSISGFERAGEGRHVRLSMMEAVLAFMWASDMSGQTFVGDEPARQEPAPAFDLIYETADGYMTVAALTDRQWAGLARVVGRLEWMEDERFKTPALRQKNIDARLELTQAALMTRPAAEWLELLTAAGVPCGPVLTRNQVIRHPQVAALGLVVETEHPQAGRLRQTRPAARFSHTPAEIRWGAPALGEHTHEVLSELGYSAAEIAALRPGSSR